MPSDCIAVPALEAELRKCGLSLPSSAALQGLASYLSLLMRWNKIMNLVGARTWEEALGNLVADSFHLPSFFTGLSLPEHPTTWDLGAGAGIPGIPLRLVWTAGEYILVEKRAKRAMFLKQACGSLHLVDTKVFSGDARLLFSQSKPADMVISRAFMPWRTLLDFVGENLAEDGLIVCMENMRFPTEEKIPAGWTFCAEESYTSHSSVRWLWALSKRRVAS